MTPSLDPVTLEVIRNALPAIANEMAADLTRTSYNMMIYEVRDFCTSIVDIKGQLIAQNAGGVSHFVADLGVIVEDAVKRYGLGGFNPGDVLITNHQAVAGQHLNNMVVYAPVFRDGQPVYFAMVRAHWIDIGGHSTGFGGGPEVSDPWLEGLQINQHKILEAGRPNETLFRMIGDNVRYPQSSLGDLRSQIAACHLAVRRFDELFERFGPDTLSRAISQIFDETEAKCRKVLAGLPDGIYEAESFLDHDLVEKSEPIRLHARIEIRGSDMTVDLSGCASERRAGINARTLAAARVAYAALTAPLAPMNEGSFRALKVIIPEGNLMMARFPAPMSLWSVSLPTVVDVILKALAPAMRDFIPAAHHGTLGGAIVFFGRHPETGQSFIVQSLEGGGWGGRPHEDGESATLSVCQGDVRNASIEGIELKCPVLIEERSLRPDSGGPGKYRGGLGLDVRVRNLVEGYWNMPSSQRTKAPPWGLWQGKDGGTAGFLLKEPGDEKFRPMEVHRYPVPVDSEVVVRTGGGGGWGDPMERDPEAVRWDVMEGAISLPAAQEEYGVVLNCSTLAVEVAATARLRSKEQL